MTAINICLLINLLCIFNEKVIENAFQFGTTFSRALLVNRITAYV